MSWRKDNIRPLYLLALFQLVAVSLVPISVTILCQQTARKAADQGFAGTLSMAWKGPEFHAALAAADVPAADRTKSSLPASDPSADPVKAKMPSIARHTGPLVLVNPGRRRPLQDFTQRWTPALPLPPPGPPPRVS